MKITITSPVQHDGKDLEVGETVSIADRLAQKLIDAGSAERADKVKAAPPVQNNSETESAVNVSAQDQLEADQQDGQQ